MLFFLLFVLIASIVFMLRKQYSYWDNTNIPHLETKFPFGVLTPLIRQKRAFGLIISDIYAKSTEKILGIYVFFRPTLLIRDAQLARQILTSDFGSFHDRGLYVDEENDPLSENLFVSRGQNWRTLRAKLTPSFTSGKLKGMFETIDDVGNKLVKYLNAQLENSPNGKTFEMKDIMTTYAVDIIGSVIFGLDIDSFTNPNNEVRKLHTDIVKSGGVLQNIFNIVSFICPPIASAMVRLGYRDPILRDMHNLMEHTVKLREQNKTKRKDLLQLLVQLRNTGKISEDDDFIWNVETAAETTAATASFAIYELSMYPALLKCAQDEVREVLKKHGIKPGEKFNYDALMEMKFLELCLMETTRKYPGLPFLNRECSQDFQLPDTKYTVKKGTPVLISLFGMQRDAQYFPDPLRFNPERFLEESKNYDPAAYMPFGEGPRHCIAQRMGKLNSKLAVAKVLANFDIKTRELKEPEFMFHAAPVLITKEGLQVHLLKRQ